MTAIQQLQELMKGTCNNQMQGVIESAIWILADIIDKQQIEITKLEREINWLKIGG
jgi:hypothetical protein